MKKISYFSKTKYASFSIGNHYNANAQPLALITCPNCSIPIEEEKLVNQLKICSKCQYHFPATALERILFTADNETFEEFDQDYISQNIINFPGYNERLQQARDSSGINEAVVCGRAKIGGNSVILIVMDNSFMMGSMGTIVGEKIVRSIERAIEQKLPLIIFCTSGGARMQEGILSLMQMAKTSASLARLNQAGLLYISVLTHPTTGGVTASFASLADIIIAEPGALVGFAGPRVIKQTIRTSLPDDFQRSEYLLQHGMVDLVISRAKLSSTLVRLLSLHAGEFKV